MKKEESQQERSQVDEKETTRKKYKYIGKRGEMIESRKMHMTQDDLNKVIKRFEEETKDVPLEVKEKAGPDFYNPYRRAGAYYGQVQSLYLLNANEWHHEGVVRDKMQEIMSEIFNSKKKNVWSIFNDRPKRTIAGTELDTQGRIRQNFKVLQRMTGNTPYGFKLGQVKACIDIKITVDEVEVWFFRLNTKYDKNQVPFYNSELPDRRGRKPKAVPREISTEQIKRVEVVKED